MQPANTILSSGHLQLQEQYDSNIILIGNTNCILNTLRFIETNPVQEIIVFAPDATEELIFFCSCNNSIKILKEEFSKDAVYRADRIMIVKDNLSESVTITGTKTEVIRRVKQLLTNENNNEEKKWKTIATKLIIAFTLMVIGHIVISYLPLPTLNEFVDNVKPYFDWHFLFFVLAGFAAQMVDGALSMGYGVISATCLMSFGVPPVASSAAIHTSEIFTTGISGYSHYKFGNVNKKLFKHLVIPGVLGAIAGALLLVLLGEKAGKWLMPLIAIYAMFLGLKIILKALQQKKANSKAKRIGWLAGAGGFLDSFGGGGWGPIVTSTLVAKGRDPKYTVGSVCLTEFFVTLASATTFFIMVGVSHWNIVLGLIIGGSLAAPIAARLTGKLPKKTMMIAVGVIVMIWCVRMLIKTLF